MKQLSDQEYIKNNENRWMIMKQLGMTESQFYKRNKELGISRNIKIIPLNKKDKKYKFDFISNKWVKKV